MSHIPYAAEHPDDDPTWHADGSSLDRVFAERDRYLATLQQIAAAGPMFSPDDWRWKVAKSALQGASFDFPGTDSGQPEDGKIKALWGGSVSDDDVAEIFGAPV